MDGKLVVVTGASRGIGAAVATAVGALGARVVRISRSLTDSDDGDIIDRRCDVTDGVGVARIVDSIVQRWGVPDAVINNAGAFVLAGLEHTTEADFRAQVETNLVGPFIVLRAIVPLMVGRGSGHLVTIGSIADHLALPGNAAYGASKYGVRGLHQVIREEIRGTGVRATLVSPGPTDTSLWDALDPDNDDNLPDRVSMLGAAHVADAVVYALTRPAGVSVDLIRISPTG